MIKKASRTSEIGSYELGMIQTKIKHTCKPFSQSHSKEDRQLLIRITL